MNNVVYFHDLDLPKTLEIRYQDSRAERASKIKIGDSIIDCSFKLFVVKEVFPEYLGAVVALNDEDYEKLSEISSMTNEIFASLPNEKYAFFSDVLLTGEDGKVCSFIYCCHFPDEHKTFYPEESIG